MIKCNVLNVNQISHMVSMQYQWSVDESDLKIGNDTYFVLAPSHIQSTIKVTCEVFVELHSSVAVCGSDSAIIKPNGKILNCNGYCIVMLLMNNSMLLNCMAN